MCLIRVFSILLAFALFANGTFAEDISTYILTPSEELFFLDHKSFISASEEVGDVPIGRAIYLQAKSTFEWMLPNSKIDLSYPSMIYFFSVTPMEKGKHLVQGFETMKLENGAELLSGLVRVNCREGDEKLSITTKFRASQNNEPYQVYYIVRHLDLRKNRWIITRTSIRMINDSE